MMPNNRVDSNLDTGSGDFYTHEIGSLYSRWRRFLTGVEIGHSRRSAAETRLPIWIDEPIVSEER